MVNKLKIELRKRNSTGKSIFYYWKNEALYIFCFILNPMVTGTYELLALVVLCTFCLYFYKYDICNANHIYCFFHKLNSRKTRRFHSQFNKTQLNLLFLFCRLWDQDCWREARLITTQRWYLINIITYIVLFCLFHTLK